jgi:hypothetical protein
MQARRLLVLPLLISVCAALVAAQSSQNELSVVDHTDSILFTASRSTTGESGARLADVISPSEFRGHDLTTADGSGIHEWARTAIRRIQAEHIICCSVVTIWPKVQLPVSVDGINLAEIVPPPEFMGRVLTKEDGSEISDWARTAIKRIRAERAVCCSVYVYASDIRPLHGLFVRDHSELKHSIR